MKVTVSYLQMFAAPECAAIECPDEQTLVCLERLTADQYLSLYKEIGADYYWDTRLKISKEELKAILESESNEILVLKQGSERIGICEFDTSAFPEIEIKHFGLVGKVHGKGFGRFFLDYALRQLWFRNPSRVWLHTDTNDHPNAIPTYQRAGFSKYKEEEEEFPDD